MSDIFDYKKLFENFYQEKEIVDEVIQIFIDTTGKQIVQLDGWISDVDKNLADIRFTIHSIKGSAYNITAVKTGDIATAIQKACDEKDIAAIPKLYESFKKSYFELKNSIETALLE